MHNRSSPTRWLAGFVFAGIGVAGLQPRPGSVAQVPHEQARLTGTTSAQPATWPVYLSNGPLFQTTPALVTDPFVLGFMHSLVFGVSSGPPPASDAAIAARAVNVEAGYAAAYEEQDGSPEIGVFALRMKKPASEEPAVATAGRGGRIIKGRVAIFYWSDAIGNRPDRGCLDVVRRHIESINFK